MSPSIQNLNISLTLDASRRLERMAQERGDTSEGLASLLLEQSILKKGCESTIRIVQNEGRENEYNDPKGLLEIIRRQDNEISWLREEISRISIHPPVHLVFHGPEGGISQNFQAVMETQAKSEPQGRTERSDDSRENDRMDSAPPQLSDDFSGDQFSQAVDPSSYTQDILTHPSDRDIAGEHQVSGKTLRDLVGGVTGDKKYTLFEAAAIAGEPESVLLEYINDGFLPAMKQKDTYLIRGNDLRQYILSK